MNAVAYFSPYIPPEWIAAHGLMPRRIEKPREESGGTREGCCFFAAAMADRLAGALNAGEAVAFAPTCDQLRRAAEAAGLDGDPRVFWMHVPASDGSSSRALYRSELERLGRFLVRMGGSAPTHDRLVEALAQATADRAANSPVRPTSGIPVALVGGHTFSAGFIQSAADAGASVVLDATETGERMQPGPMDAERFVRDPIGTLEEAYFANMPDAARHPNETFHRWLKEKLAECGARGVIFVRNVGCDLWQMELARVRERCCLPVLDLDGCVRDDAPSRQAARLAAFVESLRGAK